ncbi:HpcH/HpaI aldolase/citrate lyase family protein [Smaragdicoccus niigatensis]|uniref:HpcH/HpaI aldolase/citrate lyase family protein n=1 Tax=Smaragdicoccus niigatensis TaxID=359359 RepID=UPI000382937A|nr:CoA ester lyase [Smaragdicoccus niigatensis]
MTWTPAGPAWLFCPADRPERYAKAAERADVVILDLEDAVAPENKAAAREALVGSTLDPARTAVRINRAGTDDWVADMKALVASPFRTVLLAKCESEREVIDTRLLSVIPMIETVRGALSVGEMLRHANVIGVTWGCEDLAASLGGTSSRRPDGTYLDTARHVRTTALMSAKALGHFAIDAVFADIPDLDGIETEAAEAAAMGYDGKAVIHPNQVEPVRTAFRPDDAQLAWARGVLAAGEGQGGVFTFDGKMVDEPVLRQAQRMVARAGV